MKPKFEIDIPHDELFGTFDPKLNDAPIAVSDASSGDGIIRTDEQMNEWAEALDCTIRKANDYQLFIDIDTDHQFAIFERQLPILEKHWPTYLNWIATPSKQGLPHRHVVIRFAKALDLMTRIALQAAMGSDPTRELLSIRRALNKEENVVVFFEKR